MQSGNFLLDMGEKLIERGWSRWENSLNRTKDDIGRLKLGHMKKLSYSVGGRGRKGKGSGKKEKST